MHGYVRLSHVRFGADDILYVASFAWFCIKHIDYCIGTFAIRLYLKSLNAADVGQFY